MPEYIYEIEEDQSDESEIFIGWIRRHSEQLARCKDCAKYTRCMTVEEYYYCNMTGALVKEDDFCSWAERKEE